MKNTAANFRDDSNFPPYEKLAEDYNISRSYYRVKNHELWIPRKHWCLLAQISGIHIIASSPQRPHDTLVLDVCDKNGALIKVRLRALDSKSAIEQFISRMAVGDTLAVMYALQQERPRYQDVDMKRVVVRQACLAKAFSVSLDDLLELSDRIGKFSRTIAGKKTCHGCGKRKATLKCAKCFLFWYCGKACQVEGWKNKGHKGDCELLRDAELRQMFLTDWSAFDGFRHFEEEDSK